MKKTNKEFEDRFIQFNDKSLALKKQYTELSWTRVVTFFIAAILIVISANSDSSAGVITVSVLFVIVFFTLMKKHSTVKREKIFQEELALINQEELLRQTGDLSSFDPGSEFIQAEHQYHIDLDIFGKNSLFQLLNRTSTGFGKTMLAKWLSQPEQKDVVEQRNEAVKELGPKIDWRQNFEAYGRSYKEEGNGVQSLLEWLKEANSILPNKFYGKAIFIFPVITITTLFLWLFGLAPVAFFSLSILINVGILASVQKQAKDIYDKTVKSNQALKAFENQIRLIEGESFDSKLLSSLRVYFINDNIKASASLKELQFILDNLHNRMNMMYWVFNMAFLLDVIWLIKAEKWKEKTKADIKEWFVSIGKIECLNSLAGCHHANPDFSFPKMSLEPFIVKGTQVGHPLIKREKRISNDFDFSGKGGICLITGSNMSGKSTFLRTVGVNTVMAMMGAPVCAESFDISYLKVFTSMRTEDDLEESVSSFYAELKRLKQLLGSINSEVPLLFMVDEVLKGTNSEDRHKGAHALIRQLNKTDAFGFVSTHDIELGKITNELQGVKNYSFNSIIEGDEIIFDYTLTEGICKSFNATKLMQKMGIEIIE